MAKNISIIQFTGSVGDITAYEMRGVKGTVVRRKKGPKRDHIKNHPHYELTRKSNEEWSAATTLVKKIGRAMHEVKHLGDYNYWGHLSAIAKKIQQSDTIGQLGKRSASLATAPHLLEGFGFNKYNTLEQIVQSPITYTLDRQQAHATVAIPQLFSNLNLKNPAKQAMFRLVFVLGVVPAIVFDEENNKYIKEVKHPYNNATAYTPWCNWKLGMEACQLELKLPNWQNEENLTLILAAGIEYGQYVGIDDIRYVKYAGAGRIVKLSCYPGPDVQ